MTLSIWDVERGEDITKVPFFLIMDLLQFFYWIGCTFEMPSWEIAMVNANEKKQKQNSNEFII